MILGKSCEITLLNFGFCGALSELKYLNEFESGLTMLVKEPTISVKIK